MDKTYADWLQELSEALEVARNKANRALAEGPTARERELAMDISTMISAMLDTVGNLRTDDLARKK